ncbi:hypothetical protein [Rhizobium sp. Root1203]|uniref:hypothetical protein n=1 Tax=Rhizobium sp. Root1203 TaxID=1736427 RepID=UPI001FCD0DCF|nr:hypothetical protein [Rhizobium sp. Root1203]
MKGIRAGRFQINHITASNAAIAKRIDANGNGSSSVSASLIAGNAVAQTSIVVAMARDGMNVARVWIMTMRVEQISALT